MDLETGTDPKRLLIGAAVATLIVGTAGIMLGRTVLAPSPASTEAGPSGEAEEEGHVEGLVEMDAKRAASAGIVTETAQAGSLGAEILAQGVVAPTPDGEAILTARADGAVVRIAKGLGDAVAAGETIAWLESRDAAAIAAERSSAAARVALARVADERGHDSSPVSGLGRSPVGQIVAGVTCPFRVT